MAILNWFGDKAISNMAHAKSISLQASALIVEGQAKLLCPVGQYPGGKVGGNLRNSITHEVDEKKQVVRVGTNVEYAIYVELGTIKMEAQPYLNPALEMNRGNINKLMEHALKQASK